MLRLAQMNSGGSIIQLWESNSIKFELLTAHLSVRKSVLLHSRVLTPLLPSSSSFFFQFHHISAFSNSLNTYHLSA